MSVEARVTRENPVAASRAQAEEAQRLDPMKPLLAGAHARGMADALEIAGVPFVMMDGKGMVLHAGAPARALFGADLRVEYDHLVAGSAEATCAIQAMLMDALGPGDLPQPVRIPRDGADPLLLRAQRVPGAACNVYQLLKVLILIDTDGLSSVRN